MSQKQVFNPLTGTFDLITEEYISPTSDEGDVIYNDGDGDIALPIGDEGEVLAVENGIPKWEDPKLLVAGDWIRGVPLLNNQQTWRDVVELDILPSLDFAGSLALILRRSTDNKKIDSNIVLTFSFSRENGTYDISQNYAGEPSGVTFRIDPASHVLQYKTDDMVGTNYEGDFDIRSLNGDIVIKIVQIDNSWIEGVDLDNNQQVWKDINEFIMAPEFKRSGSLAMIISRKTDDNAINANVRFDFSYNSSIGTYSYSSTYTGYTPPGVQFRINSNTSKLQYMSDDLAGANYQGELSIRSMQGAIVIETDAVNGSVLSANGNAISVPKVDQVLRDSFTPEQGMLVFNTTTNKFQGFDGTNWDDIT